jgi:hypothetical protein
MNKNELISAVYKVLESHDFMRLHQLADAVGVSDNRIRTACRHIPDLAETDNGFLFLAKNYTKEKEEMISKGVTNETAQTN